MAIGMTPRQRVLRALQGGCGDCVPFTMYECMIPQCRAERELRNRGMCIVQRDVPVFIVRRPNVKVTQHTFWEADRKMTRMVFETPVGQLDTLSEDAGFTQWHHARMFKQPEDYAALRFLIKDEVYEPNYEAFSRAQSDFGEDAIFRAQIGLEPLQALISGTFMDTQTFCLEWMDRRDEVLKLYDAIVENRRRIYPLVAQSPASHANYGGNVVPEIIGLANFERYYVPHYNEAAQVLHQHGKLVGSHFDANCRALSAAITETELDYVEAFTPFPDTDMTLGEARQAWPNKTIWMNFPSSFHLRSDEAVMEKTVDLLNEVPTVDGLLIGITEDIPQDRWRDSCRAIMDGIACHARDHAHLYQSV